MEHIEIFTVELVRPECPQLALTGRSQPIRKPLPL